MADYMRTMLDELMGPNRNQDQATTKHFDDPDVCKFFIHDFCPNDLFLNTRADLGMCRKLHDDRLRREYHLLSAHDKDRYRYADLLHDYTAQLLRDLERKIRRGHSRLNARGDENLERATQAQRDERMERQVELEERIKRMQSDMERLADDGMIDEAKDVSAQIDAVAAQLNSVRHAEDREKRTIVCEVCGALLASNDAPERMADHLDGKQHMGYHKLREYNNCPAPLGELPRAMEKVLAERRAAGLLRETGFGTFGEPVEESIVKAEVLSPPPQSALPSEHSSSRNMDDHHRHRDSHSDDRRRRDISRNEYSRRDSGRDYGRDSGRDYGRRGYNEGDRTRSPARRR